MTLRGWAIGLAGLAFGLSSLSALAQPVEVSYEQIWGKEAVLPLAPIRVTLSNKGDARQVILTLEDGHGRQRTPVDLPSGSQKELEFIVRPTIGASRLLIQEGFSTRLVNLEVGTNPNSAGTLAVISDTPGDFSAVRAARLRPEDPTSMDVYAAPGRAPTRMAAYTGVAAIILGEGAERMTDAEVSAIQQAVVAGTLLVVPTGAPKPVLADPRWQGWWPARITGTRNVTDFSAFARDGAPPQGTLTMVTAEAVPGATLQSAQGVMLTASHSVGLGRVLLLGYDPSVGTLRQWPSLGRHLVRVLISERNAVGPQVGRGLAQGLLRGPFSGWDAPESGLELQAPPASLIWISFAVFLVVIGPVQFLVLRRMDKGELAWVVTPVLSVAFAMGLVTVGQRGLARFQQRETRAVLATNASGSLTAGAASQTFFLPESGGYDLRIPPTDVIGFEAMGFGGTEAALPYVRDIVEDGTMSIPQLQVNSLAFVPINLLGQFPATPGIESQLAVGGTQRRTVIEGRLRNRSERPWRGAALFIGPAPIPWTEPLGNAGWIRSFDRFRRTEGAPLSIWTWTKPIAPGEFEPVSGLLTLEQVRAVAEGAPIWLVVYVGDEGIGSPVGQAAKSSSVEIYQAMNLENREFARQVAAAIPESRLTGGRR